MKTDQVFLEHSNIDGQGVFAARNFHKGEVVLQWDTSHLLTKKEFAQLSDKDQEYVAFKDGKYVAMQEPERYVNHSCDANTEPREFSDIATRTIQKGEEITSDYSQDMPPGMEMACNCGSKNCKRSIKEIS
ncbi:MAG: SET domain-containing protein-lysine N-methyltransferase [bacterium]|nr:SET domain-containing protein-lysine N-methyltransferase [bacterium]